MPDDRESPSAGWREVYHEMGVETNVEAATRPCPDCGRQCENVLRDVYECDDHGVFRVGSGEDEPSDSNSGSDSDPDESDDAKHRAEYTAD